MFVSQPKCSYSLTHKPNSTRKQNQTKFDEEWRDICNEMNYLWGASSHFHPTQQNDHTLVNRGVRLTVIFIAFGHNVNLSVCIENENHVSDKKRIYLQIVEIKKKWTTSHQTLN